MGKYEKRVGKIWEKYDPNSFDQDLDIFINQNHPSVIDLERRIHSIVRQILFGIQNQNSDRRKSFVEDTIYQSWSYFMKHDKLDFLFRECCDEYLCRRFYGIEMGEENWTGKSTFEFDEKDLDELWNNIWEWSSEEGHWGSEDIKKLIWENEYGLRRDCLSSIKEIQEMISPEMKAEIEERKRKTETCYKVFRPLREKFESDNEAGKMDDWSVGQWREAKPVFRHDRDYSKQTWEVQYICEDIWGDLDHEAIYEKVRKEQEKD